ncbi:LarC family nickel insertion protein [uncultured Cohaesibacter sp.]|uniref:LarC family nickel insertion protein n=1 Tax=uncultured Cohaesibacter sp. TaxID=1002546 RepID=UPI0029C763B4|nr:LarC family nickel insertion protein [uncultured Cohaesibacter sp.]
MPLHGHFDVVGGISGDMTLGAFLDAFPHLEQGLRKDLAEFGISDHVELTVRKDKVMGLQVTRVDVDVATDAPPTHHWRDIRAFISNASANPDVKALAIAIFAHLAEAEAICHGVDVEKVHFHEVADWDSLADIIGVASCVIGSGIESWSCSALPPGSGRVQMAHGLLPVPAPATCQLLKGFEMSQDDEEGERITPTGAAILKTLVTTPRASAPAGWLGELGVSAGSKSLVRQPNILRLFVSDISIDKRGDMVTRLSFDIDDMTAEEMSLALDRIRQAPFVLDAGYHVGFGKKGRMRFCVEILGIAGHGDSLIELCFAETSTIGLRVDECRRSILERLDAPENVKRVRRPNGVTAKTESDSLAQISGLKDRRATSRETERQNES